MRRSARPFRMTALAVIGSLALIAPFAPVSASAATDEKYVALGDSYSAGSGVLPLDPAASPICLRTNRNYPHLVAGALKPASFTDVTCGAATTAHFTKSQYPLIAGPQLDAVKSDTTLVTLTIGGNDNNTFIGAILACASPGIATLGLGSPCKNIYGNTFVNDVRSKTGPAIKASLAAIRAKAPRAKVMILGYPWIVPATGSCFTTMPIAKGDVPYLRNLQATLNGVIKDAAAATGSTYVDMSAASEGHDACQKSGVRWVEPVLWGTGVVPVHPNALGESKMAEAVLAAR